MPKTTSRADVVIGEALAPVGELVFETDGLADQHVPLRGCLAG